MSPKSMRKKVNLFIEEVVLTNKEATAIIFEELGKSCTTILIIIIFDVAANTTKVHRHHMH